MIAKDGAVENYVVTGTQTLGIIISAGPALCELPFRIYPSVCCWVVTLNFETDYGNRPHLDRLCAGPAFGLAIRRRMLHFPPQLGIIDPSRSPAALIDSHRRNT